MYRPGTFTGLMTLYESNYIKLHNLTAAFDWPSDSVISAAPEDIDLHATIMRREPYTTTLKLTYWFPEAEGVTVADPDLIAACLPRCTPRGGGQRPGSALPPQAARARR